MMNRKGAFRMVTRTAFRTAVLTAAMILFIPLIVMWAGIATRD